MVFEEGGGGERVEEQDEQLQHGRLHFPLHLQIQGNHRKRPH